MSLKFLEVEDLGDLIEHADYVREIYYKMYDIDEDVVYAVIIAGRLIWRGEINKNTPRYRKLMSILEVKGTRVKKIVSMDDLVEVVQ